MIAAILAAGKATRFGGCKQVHVMNGLPMICRVIEALPEAIDEIIVVTGAYKEEVDKAIEKYQAKTIFNDQYSKGKSSSLKSAVSYALLKKEDLFLTLADLPYITKKENENLFNEFDGEVVFSEFENRSGPPAIFPFNVLTQLLNLEGEKGAKSLFPYAKRVYVPNASRDIDFKQEIP